MFLFELMNLGEGFKKYFEVVPATTDELKDHVFRIRHNVYCEELKFEPERPDKRETDEYDSHSLHCLIRHIRSGEFAGCTRLVLARPGDPMYPLPFERSCEDSIDRNLMDPRALPRHTIAEVSRLAVVGRFRRRKGEEKTAAPVSDDSFGTKDQPRFPYIPVGLYLGTIEMAALHGIDTLFVLTEPRLAGHFSKLGVKTRQIGRPIEHRGTRVPSAIGVSSVIDGLNFVMRPLYKVIASEVRAALRDPHEE